MVELLTKLKTNKPSHRKITHWLRQNVLIFRCLGRYIAIVIGSYMESFKFVDMYFHSQNEIVDIRESELRDINTLFSYLNNLHSLADKMKDKFDIKLANYPEFKVLRILRNYFHHVDDIDELCSGTVILATH
ncbi:hypothetical protein [Pseudoalteromonas fuliginea]|uniref:hypothetical protein n=1 Tax=Pseudoalteromonas fuliginea TaxID=1872678 RepID=UPI00317D491D